MFRSPTPHPVVEFFRRFGLAILVFAIAAALTLESYRSTLEEQRVAAHNQFQDTAQQQIARFRERVMHLLGYGDALQRQIRRHVALGLRPYRELVAGCGGRPGAGHATASVLLFRSHDRADARKLMFASFIYLLLLQLAYVLDRLY